jgi:hypothetical protein
MRLVRSFRGTGVPLVLVAIMLAGCSGADGEQAQELARQSCEYPAPEAPNFDAQTAAPELLAELANAARTRADLAEQAAGLDERWQPLSDAATALAAYAERIREIRRDGGIVADEMPAEVWDQVKYASDAFILECRAAVGA